MSSAVVSRKGMLLGATARVSNGMSPTSAVFISSSLTSRARFCLVLIARAAIGACRSVKGGL